jgi:hypothetical protein
MALWHQQGGNGVMPTKICPPDKTDCNGKQGCNRLVPVSATDCPFCLWHWETQKEAYDIELQLVVESQKEENMTIKQWCACKKLEGWGNQRILIAIMVKNKDNMKKAFTEAIGVLRTENGEYISPQYYYFLKKHVIDKKNKK